MTKMIVRDVADNGMVIKGMVTLIDGVETKNCWRAEVRIDDFPMGMSHHNCSADAEKWATEMQQVYLKVHARKE